MDSSTMPAQPAGCSAETDMGEHSTGGRTPTADNGPKKQHAGTLARRSTHLCQPFLSGSSCPARCRVSSSALVKTHRVKSASVSDCGATTRSTPAAAAPLSYSRTRSPVDSIRGGFLWRLQPGNSLADLHLVLHSSLPVLYFLLMKTLRVKPLWPHAGGSGCLSRRGVAEVHQRWCSSRLRRAVLTSAASR